MRGVAAAATELQCWHLKPQGWSCLLQKLDSTGMLCAIGSSLQQLDCNVGEATEKLKVVDVVATTGAQTG